VIVGIRYGRPFPNVIVAVICPSGPVLDETIWPKAEIAHIIQNPSAAIRIFMIPPVFCNAGKEWGKLRTKNLNALHSTESIALHGDGKLDMCGAGSKSADVYNQHLKRENLQYRVTHPRAKVPLAKMRGEPES